MNLSLKPLWLLAIFCWAYTASAQQSAELDSLSNLLEAHPHQDSVRLQVLQELGAMYLDVDNNRSADYYRQSGEIARKLNLSLYEWRAFYNVGYSNFAMGKYEPAIENYLEAIKIAEAQKYIGRLARTYMALGNVFLEMGDFAKARDYHDQSARVYIKANDTLGLANYFNEIALAHNHQMQLDSAEFYFNKGMHLAVLIKDSLMQADLLSNLGLNYKKQKRYPEALQMLKAALRLGLQVYDKPDYAAALYNNLGAGYMVNGKFDSAKAAYFTSIEKSKQAASLEVEMENYRNLGELFEMTNQPDSQLAYLKKYYVLKDSLMNADIKTAITKSEAEYRLDKKQMVINEQQLTRNWLLALAALLLMAGTAIFFAWRQTRRTNKQLVELNEHIVAQKNQLEKLNLLKDRLMGVISHDLRNPLATIQTFFEISTNPQLPKEQLAPLQQHTRQVVENTTQLLDNLLVWARMQVKHETPVLHAVVLGHLIEESVEQMAPMANKKQIDIEVSQPAQLLKVMAQEEMLRIIFRNLLTNAIKFSKTNSVVQVLLHAENGIAVIAVKDEGIGMTPQQLNTIVQQNQTTTSEDGTEQEKGSGLGVFLVTELLKPMKGKMEIESTYQAGSVFKIKLPLA